jgi:hypothetical protein
MSNNKQINKASDDARQSRKEVLLARKQAEQTRQVRIAMGIVAGIIGIVLLIAIINELILTPNRSVATVGEQQITLKSFQERVKFERARRIILLEDQLEAFGGDVGIIQQFASQLLVDLFPANAEGFGEAILNQMVDELLILQAATARGITVSDADVAAEIGRSFNFFDGGLPTPFPTSTPTTQPTPSVTPLGALVMTDTVEAPPTPTLGPTNTPFPTATAVSPDSFQEQYSDLLNQYRALNISEASFRDSVRTLLLRQRLADALGVEAELDLEAPHTNFYLFVFSDEGEAEEVSGSLTPDNYLEVWNAIRSQSADAAQNSTAFATELFRRSEADIAANFSEQFATAVANTPLNTPTPVILVVDPNGGINYFIAVPSGRETLPLAESTLETQKAELLNALLTELRGEGVLLRDFWRTRVPTTPALDDKFFAPPTATPEIILPESLPSAPTD